MPRQAISHDTVLGKLGAGGMGAVCRARDMPEKDKRLLHWDGGHACTSYHTVIKEALD